MGFILEADECAVCIRDGKLESEIAPLQDTLAILKLMDEVRDKGGLEYPSPLEDVKA